MKIKPRAAVRTLIKKGKDVEVTAVTDAKDGLGNAGQTGKRNIGWVSE